MVIRLFMSGILYDHIYGQHVRGCVGVIPSHPFVYFRMAKDCQGILRGACTVCDCTCRMFVSTKGIRCDYCDDFSSKHINLSTSPSKPPSLQPVVTNGIVEEDSDENGMSLVSDEALRSAIPSTPNMFGKYTR